MDTYLDLYDNNEANTVAESNVALDFVIDVWNEHANC